MDALENVLRGESGGNTETKIPTGGKIMGIEGNSGRMSLYIT